LKEEKKRLVKDKDDRWEQYKKLQNDLADLAKGGGNELIA